MKILIVIVSYKEVADIPSYLSNNLDAWLAQECDYELDIVISDNRSKSAYNSNIRRWCLDHRTENKNFHYITYPHHEPLFISINSGFLFGKKNLQKEYDYYIYCSDDTVMTKANDLTTIIDTFNKVPDAGIVSALVDSDNAAHVHPYNSVVGDGSPLKINIGESVNLHFMCFSKEYMQKYDHKYPDVLISYATETLLTFFAKAISKEWYICRSVKLNNQNRLKRLPKHLRRPGKKKKYVGIIGYGIYKNFKTFDQIFKDGVMYGLGFETWRRHNDHKARKNPNPFWYLPKKSCYDEHKKCKNPNALYQYIKTNLFLPKSVMDYDVLLDSMLRDHK